MSHTVIPAEPGWMVKCSHPGIYDGYVVAWVVDLEAAENPLSALCVEENTQGQPTYIVEFGEQGVWLERGHA